MDGSARRRRVVPLNLCFTVFLEGHAQNGNSRKGNHQQASDGPYSRHRCQHVCEDVKRCVHDMIMRFALVSGNRTLIDLLLTLD